MLAQIAQSPEWFAGWGTLALVNAGIAQATRRTGFPWFLASLLLGPIATLILVLTFDSRRSR